MNKQAIAEEIERVKKQMKELSLPIDHEPRKLFHATQLSNFRSIQDNGIMTNEIYGEVYFCEKEKQCLKFVKKPCIIFEVDPSQLDMQEMFLSREAKQFQTFQYYLPVEKEAIKGWNVYK